MVDAKGIKNHHNSYSHKPIESKLEDQYINPKTTSGPIYTASNDVMKMWSV